MEIETCHTHAETCHCVFEVKHSEHAEVSRRWEVGPDTRARCSECLGRGFGLHHKVFKTPSRVLNREKCEEIKLHPGGHHEALSPVFFTNNIMGWQVQRGT